jgi:galactokinase
MDISDLFDFLDDSDDLIAALFSSKRKINDQGYTGYAASGRVNLIGEHIDYNGGLVMPIAINLGIKGLYKQRDDNMVCLYSTTHEKRIAFALSDIPQQYVAANDWANYPIGVILALKKKGLRLTGFDLFFDSILPEGSGLSSSAAIEVLTAHILLTESNVHMGPTDVALLCQQVENEFIGVKCGIMDQFAVANCKKDHALLLDCNNLEYEQLPFELDGYSLLVINSKKPRSLIKSAYNERKAESEAAYKILLDSGKLTYAEALVHADIADLEVIGDPVIRRRARHVISEHLRVKQSATALRMGDLHTFGRLMNASHRSMKEDYEVTGLEMDTLAETAQHIDGCIGARMTGGGFGGCAIALVKKGNIDSFRKILTDRYQNVTGLQCAIYECVAVDGVQ